MRDVDSVADGPGRYMGSSLDLEHAPIWRWLEQQVEPYPTDRFIAPLRPRRPPRRPRSFGGAVLDVADPELAAWGKRSRLTVSYADGQLVVQLTGGAIDAEVIAAQLFTHRRRGTVVVLPDGARRSLHVLLRLCWRRWVELGFRVKPLGVGTELRYLVVSRGRHAWYLADWEGLTGLHPGERGETITTLAGVNEKGGNFAQTVRLAAEGYQRTVSRHFGVSVGLTVGSTAVACVCRHVPDDGWVWRPPPGLVALCRAGGGFRGGHVHYPPYRGPVHRLDLRRAYTWALSVELPGAAAQSECVVDGREQPGIYLCHVYGPGTHPISLAEWQGADRGFVRRNWSGAEAIAVLSTDEFAGIKALGYAIAPGFGYCWRRTFSLRGFTDACERLLLEHGERSAVGLVAKRIANAVYGKLAERPLRQELVMSEDAPGDDYLPMVDAAGDEVEHVWTRWVSSHRPHQHVDVAAVVTARVRGRLYEALACLAAAGVRCVAADTDGLFLGADPRPALGADDGRPGSWRYEGFSELETVAGPRLFTFRGTVAAAGTSPQPATVVAAAFDRGTVTVEGKVMAPPWSGGAMVRTVERRLRRGVGA